MKKWLIPLALLSGLITPVLADTWVNRVQSKTAPANQFGTGISAAGVPTFSAIGSGAMPAFTGGDCKTSAGAVVITCSGVPKAIAAWGDSITLRWPVELSTGLGRPVLGNGVSGDTSAQIKSRFDKSSQLYANTTIIWAGRNDFSNGIPNSTILANIASMVASLGHDRYLVLGILNADTANEYSGGAGYNTITALNSALSAAYGSHYFDMRAYLVSQYNAGIPQDVIDHGHDVPPSSLRVDVLHPNDAGATVIAAKLATLVAALEAASTTTKPFNSQTIDGAQQVVSYNGQLAVGLGALANNTTGQGNEAFGDYALWSNTTGSYNQVFGFHAMYASTTAVSNAVFGYQAMTSNLSGSYNSAFGTNALVNNTTGDNNMAIGANALYGNTTGQNNVGIGYAAGFTASTANENVAIGTAALFYNAANGNTAIGTNSGYTNTSGAGITAIGNSALNKNTTGSGNTALGLNAGYTNTTSSNITAAGSGALYKSTAADNTGVGFDAGYNVSTGTRTTALGSFALFGAGGGVTGNDNTAVGYGTLAAVSSGYANTAVGSTALNAATTGYSNTAVGFQALQNNLDGYLNTALGVNTLNSNSSGIYNTALGVNALLNTTTGYTNTAVGMSALSSNVAGFQNTAVGYGAGTNVNGAAASANTFVGYLTGGGITTGANNTIIGANVSGLSSGLSGAVILASGDGSIRADYGNTNGSGWTFSAPVAVKSVAIGSLPPCNAAMLGALASVNNGTAYATGTYGSAVSATGIVTRSVLCTNTAGATTYAWAYN